MNKIKKTFGLVTSLLLVLGTASAFAENDKNKDKEKDIKDQNQQVLSVPEPATLGLIAAGVAAIGLTAFLRRRKP
jgi:hypothetical protein